MTPWPPLEPGEMAVFLKTGLPLSALGPGFWLRAAGAAIGAVVGTMLIVAALAGEDLAPRIGPLAEMFLVFGLEAFVWIMFWLGTLRPILRARSFCILVTNMRLIVGWRAPFRRWTWMTRDIARQVQPLSEGLWFGPRAGMFHASPPLNGGKHPSDPLFMRRLPNGPLPGLFLNGLSDADRAGLLVALDTTLSERTNL